MGLYRVRLTWNQWTNQLRDRVVWSWGIEAGAAPDGDSLLMGLNTALSSAMAGYTLRSCLAPGLTGDVVEVYEAEGGGAITAVDASLLTITGSTARLPSEVAYAVSAQVATARGVQPKGRTYLGPFSTATLASGGAPHARLLNGALAFATQWHRELDAIGVTPIVLSGDGTMNRGPILTYSVDDAWDTQRRRGYDRTALTYATP